MASPSEPWVQSDLLAPGDPATDPTVSGLGVNGIAFHGDRLYAVVADYGRVVRIRVRDDGSAGDPATVCERAKLRTADGIAVDIAGGLWIAVNAGTTGVSPSGALYRLTPGGSLTTIADDPGWMNYPTQPVFGTSPRHPGDALRRERRVLRLGGRQRARHPAHPRRDLRPAVNGGRGQE